MEEAQTLWKGLNIMGEVTVQTNYIRGLERNILQKTFMKSAKSNTEKDFIDNFDLK